jgi:hypothetical protein
MDSGNGCYGSKYIVSVKFWIEGGQRQSPTNKNLSNIHALRALWTTIKGSIFLPESNLEMSTQKGTMI